MDTIVYTGAGSAGTMDEPVALPVGVENFEAAEGSGRLNIRGNTSDNTFSLAEGEKDAATGIKDIVDLSDGGSDIVTGSAAALNGANITGFGADDVIVVKSVVENGPQALWRSA